MRRVLKAVGKIIAFVILPAVVSEYLAFLDRGYFAVGGEAIFPILGAIWLIYPYFYSVEQS